MRRVPMRKRARILKRALQIIMTHIIGAAFEHCNGEGHCKRAAQRRNIARDIPALRRALAMPLSVAMLKGRANYVCHYYLQRTLQDAGALSHRDAAHVRAIIRFSKTSQSGDKSELAQVPESAPIWGR